MAINIDKFKQLDLQTFNKAAPALLVLLILYLCWKLAALFWLVVAPPQALQLERVELGSQQSRIPNISSFALFQETGQSAASAEVSNILLQGVMVASPSYLSSAVLKLNDQVDRYRVGESLGNSGYELAEVYWDRVIIRQQNGVSKEVFFKGMENGLNQPWQSNEQKSGRSSSSSNWGGSANQPTNEPASPQNEIGRAIQQMNENREQYLENMGVSAGEGGYEVTSRTPAVLRNRLGLRPGDRIVSLNGQTVTAGQSEVQLLEQARQQGQVKLEIKRGDQVMTIQQDLK